MLKCVVSFYLVSNIVSGTHRVIYTTMTKIPKQGFVKNPIPWLEGVQDLSYICLNLLTLPRSEVKLSSTAYWRIWICLSGGLYMRGLTRLLVARLCLPSTQCQLRRSLLPLYILSILSSCNICFHSFTSPICAKYIVPISDSVSLQLPTRHAHLHNLRNLWIFL